MITSSNYAPCDLGLPDFQSTWLKSFESSSQVDIAVGYVSAESLNYLEQLIDIHQAIHIRLVVGMAMFDGVTDGQRRQLLSISEKLIARGKGDVYIVQQFPFHGKLHMFHGAEPKLKAILGSSNLSNIVPQTGFTRGTFELDFEVTDDVALGQLRKLFDALTDEAAGPLQEVEALIPIISKPAQALVNHEGADAVSPDVLASIKALLGNTQFVLPLKTESKSSLNVYFGKGRATGSTVRPRNWYEAALIVDKSVIDAKPGYPKDQAFIVYTDDGFKFAMRTGGTNAKNLESYKDLTTFGRWIKGKLEDANVLQTGDLVTNKTLTDFGKTDLVLTKTSLRELHPPTNTMLDVWFLDYSRPGGID
jgi:hypothetical protein